MTGLVEVTAVELLSGHASPGNDRGELVAEARRGGLAAKVLSVPIHAYRWLFSWRAPVCRYDPSCSTYALEALEVHGVWRGSWLAVRRLARCHPWGGHGWDPVPPRGDADR